MIDYEAVKEEILSFFLTEYQPTQAAAYVEAIVKEHLAPIYTVEVIDQFWEQLGLRVIDDLVEEYNVRSTQEWPIPFEFLDSDGTKVVGRSRLPSQPGLDEFQVALLSLTHTEFEELAALVLYLSGCKAWVTPATHDQGIDAFGFFRLFEEGIGNQGSGPLIWVFVQAKHYTQQRLGSKEIRDTASAVLFASHKIFDQSKAKYTMIDVKEFSPVAILLVTSGDLKRTAKILAVNSGVMLLTTLDLFLLFSKKWGPEYINSSSSSSLASRLRGELEGIEVAI